MSCTSSWTSGQFEVIGIATGRWGYVDCRQGDDLVGDWILESALDSRGIVVSADEGEEVEIEKLLMRWVRVVWDGKGLRVGVGDDEGGGVEEAPLQRFAVVVSQRR